MSTSNNPVNSFAENQSVIKKQSTLKSTIIGILGVLLVSMAVYLVYDKSKSADLLKDSNNKIVSIAEEKSELQTSFDASLARLDSMSSITMDLEGQLSAKNKEIAHSKDEIRRILNSKSISTKELARAKVMIASLNEKIGGLQQEVSRLTAENQTLTQDKIALTANNQALNENLNTTTQQKVVLEQKVDIASTLNASNISITPLKVKNNGKEKVSTKAKKVDKLIVSFDVANRIIQPGVTDLYVVVTGPDGKAISTGNSFSTREDGAKSYTAKVPVVLETSKTKNVNFTFAPGTDFQTGAYKIKIYQNGFLIGEGKQELRKGGLFS